MPKATRRWSQAELDDARHTAGGCVSNHFKEPPKPRQSRAKKPETPESAILAGCLQLLAVHPKVAWAERMNTGAMKLDDRYVKFGFPGLSDIIGQLKTGQMLAVECKREGKLPTVLQNQFLYRVNICGGWACCVDSISKLSDLLKGLP